jgi:hypothetical protein
MKAKSFIWLAATLGLSLAFTSCEKDPVENNPVVAGIEDDAEAEDLYNNVFDEAGEITLDEGLLKSTEYDNGERTITRVNHGDGTRDITVVYTNWNNPRTRRDNILNGMILIHEEGYFFGETYRRRVEAQDFFINDVQVKGIKVVEKIDEHSYSSTLTGGELIFPDGQTYSREFDYVINMTGGSDTPIYIWDDVYETTGTASGIDRQDRNYSFEITSPLVRNMGWRFLVEGVIDITIGDAEAELDFGNGEFDNLAYVTYNGEVHTIRLRK